MPSCIQGPTAEGKKGIFYTPGTQSSVFAGGNGRGKPTQEVAGRAPLPCRHGKGTLGCRWCPHEGALSPLSTVLPQK